MKRLFASAAFAAFAFPALADHPVTIHFTAEIGGAPFSCAQSYSGLGATKAEMVGTDYRLFVSAPALLRADGSYAPIALEQDGRWQVQNIALLDFEDGTGSCAGTGNAGFNTSLRGTVPEGEYVGLSFVIGLPFDLNHNDPTLAPAPLNTTGMFWNWQNGFRFVRIDLAPQREAGGHDDHAHGGHDDDGYGQDHGHGDGEAAGWFLHLGSTQCAAESRTESPSACANPNHVSLIFPDFDPARNLVVIDPAPVIVEADLTVNAPETSPGCMSFPGDADCLMVMPKLGIAYEGRPAEAQRLVTVR